MSGGRVITTFWSIQMTAGNTSSKDSLDQVDGIMSRISFEGMVTSNQSRQAFVEAGRVNSDRVNCLA